MPSGLAHSPLSPKYVLAALWSVQLCCPWSTVWSPSTICSHILAALRGSLQVQQVSQDGQIPQWHYRPLLVHSLSQSTAVVLYVYGHSTRKPSLGRKVISFYPFLIGQLLRSTSNDLLYFNLQSFSLLLLLFILHYLFSLCCIFLFWSFLLLCPRFRRNAANVNRTHGPHHTHLFNPMCQHQRGGTTFIFATTF